MEQIEAGSSTAAAATSIEKVELHPAFVVRIAGEPAKIVTDLGTGETTRLIEVCEALRRDLSSRAPIVCESLERVFKRIEDRGLGRALLTVKRDLFNLRRVRQQVLEDLLPYMDPVERDAVTELAAGIRTLTDLQQSFEGVHEAELAYGRAQLPSIFARPNLRNAIRYANEDLFESLRAQYEQGKVPQKESKARKLDDTFLQYIVRASVKTSPLSSFTPTFVSVWEASGSPAVELEFANWKCRESITIKRALIHDLLSPLIQDHAAIARSFPLKVNSSLQVGTDRLRVSKIEPGNLTNGKSWGTGIATVELKLSRAVSILLDRLSATDRAVPLVELIDSLAAAMQGQDRGALQKFVVTLLAHGVLVADLDYEEQGDILDWMHKFLGRLDHPSREEYLRAADQIRNRFGDYIAAKLDDRVSATTELKNAVDGFATVSGRTLSPPMMRPILYEDCFHLDSDTKVTQEAFAPYREDLELLLGLAPLLDARTGIQSALAIQFIEKFGRSGVCHKPQEFLVRVQEEMSSDPSGRRIIAALQSCPISLAARELRAELYDNLIPRVQRETEVVIDRELVADIVSRVPQQIRARTASYSFLGQFANMAGGRKRFVLNQTLFGASFLMSRFLDVLDEERLKDVRRYVSGLGRFGTVVELPGVFGFNGNLHPSLADGELSISPYQPNRRDAPQYRIEETVLFYDDATHRLYFRAPDGKCFDVFYFGLLTPAILPPLHVVLSRLFTQGLIFFVSGELRRRRLISLQEVTVTPRVILGSVVLARRSTYLPRKFLPVPEGTDADYFRVVQSWRKQMELSARVFVRLMPLARLVQSGDATGEPWADPNFDTTEIKPFYVDFTQPLLVRLFGRLIKRNTYDALIQEALPEISDRQASIASESHVAEWEFELSRTTSRIGGG